MKKVAISMPCFNEEDNINEVINSIDAVFRSALPSYDYVIQFSDNCSTDRTREVIKEVCLNNSRVRAIFNCSNVPGSAIHSILQTDEDCCIHMASDLQDPPELIPLLIEQWEAGCGVVCAIKESSAEKKSMWWIRSVYYKIMRKFSNVKQIEHFTGFGLYDRAFIEILRRVDDPLITLRGLVAEFGYKIGKVYYKQPLRKYGKSKQNIIKNFDYAMRSFTTYTKVGLHIAVLGSFIVGVISAFLIALLFGVKYFGGVEFNFDLYLIILVLIFIGAIQTFFIGIVGEYIGNMNIRMLKRPLAVEENRIGNWANISVKGENSCPYETMPPTRKQK